MDTLTAARAQMAMSLAFHMVFAAIGIGLPFLLVIAEGLYLRTRQTHYLELSRKWAKVTGLLFAVGAISGTALSFELGLLWPKYIEITGAVVGHIFALEGYAFFIEAIFIGLYLYAWERLSPRAHWFCGVVIAISGALSGWFILGVNAWMQLPVGFTLDDVGRVVVTDPIAIFKRYAWFVMAVHSTLACYVAVAFAVASVYAWGWLRGRRDAYHTSAIRIALVVGAIGAILQPLSGDMLAKFVYQTQPGKFAAMEGNFKTQTHAPMHVGGVPDLQNGTMKYAIEIPGMLSFLAAHDFDARVIGLNDIPRSDWPNIALTHMAFDVMVGLGSLLMLISIWFWIACWRRQQRAMQSTMLMRAIVFAGPLGFVALESGWIVTEAGRQPWVINGILRTADAVTPATNVPQVFVGFCILYLILGASVIGFLRYLATAKPAAKIVAPQEAPVAASR